VVILLVVIAANSIAILPCIKGMDKAINVLAADATQGSVFLVGIPMPPQLFWATLWLLPIVSVVYVGNGDIL
jgi:hypothetical protein